MAEVCVIGAGPAGCTFAARMAALGHVTHLIEQAPFPRRRLGESLTPGVLPLLQTAGLAQALQGAHVRPASAVQVSWEGAPRRRELGAGAGFVVDRGGFDAALLDAVRAAGVRTLQPARALSWRRDGGRWRIEIEGVGRRETLTVDFLADARGRGGPAKRLGPRTIALYAYWRLRKPRATPRIAAVDDGWVWCVPLPDGLYNTLVFIDAAQSRVGGEPLAQRLQRRAAAGGLFADCGEAEPVGPVCAIDATPYLDADSVGADYLRLGDRALAIDPLSSSGVQKAVQSALSGAVVANTLLRRPERADASGRFYRSQLASAAQRHAAWAGGYYAAAERKDPFWAARARPEPPGPAAPVALAREFVASVPVWLSPQAQWRETPCLDAEFVALTPALTHPNLAEPVAFLGGAPLAPLFSGFEGGRTALEIARDWTPRLPLETGLGIAAWLAARGVLEARSQQRARA